MWKQWLPSHQGVSFLTRVAHFLEINEKQMGSCYGAWNTRLPKDEEVVLVSAIMGSMSKI